MQSGLFLDVVVRQGAAIFQLFPGKDQPLLVWGAIALSPFHTFTDIIPAIDHNINIILKKANFLKKTLAFFVKLWYHM